MSSTGSHTPANDATDETPRKAGAFDIRVFIASLIGIYGVVLVLVGLFGTSDKQLAKSDDVNINLLAGIGMVVVSAAFMAWARLRPVVVPPHAGDGEGDEQRPAASH